MARRGTVHGNKVRFNLTVPEPLADQICKYMDDMKIPHIAWALQRLINRGLVGTNVRYEWLSHVFKAGMQFQREHPEASDEDMEAGWIKVEQSLNQIL